MQDLMAWARYNKKKLHPIELAAIAHHKLVYINPFFDRNGRVARLLMNLLLMKEGYPLVVILKNDRKNITRCWKRRTGGDLNPFVQFTAQAVERSLNIYLKALLPAKTGRRYLPLPKISKQTPYSKKYLNLLARHGRIEASKEGRNWVTTVEAVNNYIKARQRQR